MGTHCPRRADPLYYVQRARVVTEQEIALLEALSGETGADVLVFGLRPENPFLSNIPALEAAKGWLCSGTVTPP